jgi:hypothetical protein
MLVKVKPDRSSKAIIRHSLQAERDADTVIERCGHCVSRHSPKWLQVLNLHKSLKVIQRHITLYGEYTEVPSVPAFERNLEAWYPVWRVHGGSICTSL